MCREKTVPSPANPLTAHIVSWFFDLHDCREYTVFAGMAGGGCIPRAIGFEQISAWAELTGNRPTHFEVTAIRAMDQAWRGAFDQKQSVRGTGSPGGRQHQAVGEYCRGAEVDGCRKTFGEQLERVCSTCPN